MPITFSTFLISSGSSSQLGFLVKAFVDSDWLGQLIVVGLLVGSVFAWSFMAWKWVEFRRVSLESAIFFNLFRQETHILNVFLKKQHFPSSPECKMYEQSCLKLVDELSTPDEGQGLSGAGLVRQHINQRQQDAVMGHMERVQAEQLLKLEHYMTALAIATSVSPLLGLFGTVWGVMIAFVGMSTAGSNTLSAVAPGISGALLTTVAGLFVAIPSSVGYSILSAQLRKIEVTMENFVDEFETKLRRTYEVE